MSDPGPHTREREAACAMFGNVPSGATRHCFRADTALSRAAIHTAVQNAGDRTAYCPSRSVVWVCDVLLPQQAVILAKSRIAMRKDAGRGAGVWAAATNRCPNLTALSTRKQPRVSQTTGCCKSSAATAYGSTIETPALAGGEHPSPGDHAGADSPLVLVAAWLHCGRRSCSSAPKTNGDA